MAGEEGNIVGGAEVVADLLNLPVAFSLSPLGSTVLKPNLRVQSILCVLKSYFELFLFARQGFGTN